MTNLELLAYHDLDGRSGFKLALQEVDSRFFLYVAGFWHTGWSILDVTEPERPELLRFVDGPPNTWTIQLQVADATMITALEHLPPSLTIGDPNAEPKDGFLIWDVHEPDRPQLLGQWVSGAAGTHRNFYNGVCRSRSQTGGIRLPGACTRQARYQRRSQRSTTPASGPPISPVRRGMRWPKP
jgi:hypothetical protein